MLVLRSLVSVAVLPGTVAVVVPALILRAAERPSHLELVGLVPLTIGLALFAWCVWLFARRGRGTLAPWDAPRRFVANGPYLVVRNPMYVGVATILLGEAILFRSLALAIWLGVMAALWHAFIVLYEEPTLEQTFGDGYREYLRRVPRWLPRLR